MPVEFDPSQPFSVLDSALAGVSPAKPSVIDTALNPPVAAPAPAPETIAAPEFDPAQPFTPVSPVSPVSPEPTGPTPTFDPTAEFQKVFTPDDLKSKTVEELDLESDFHPVEFGQQYEDQLNADPIAKQKLLDVYKLREATFRTTSDQLKDAAADPLKTIAKPFKATLEVGKSLLSGAGQVIKNVSEAGVGGAFRLLGAASVGGAAGQAGLNEEGKQIERAQAELAAAPEAAATGTVDLLRRGVRTAVETGAKLDPTGFVRDVTGEKPFSELTNEEIATRFSNDVAGKKAIAEANRGAGEMVQALGVHADKLKEAGIEVRPEVIESMSPVLDITNLVPLGAGAKVGLLTKASGRYAVRELATAATPLQASSFIKAMNAAPEVLGSATAAVGRGVEATGVGAAKVTKWLGDAGNVAGVGALAFGRGALGTGILVTAKAGPLALRATGRAIQSAAKVVPGAVRAGADIGAEFVKGYGQGLLFTVPFMVGADAEEREVLLGAAGLGGVARGGIRAVGQGRAGLKLVAEAAQDRLAESIFKAVDQSKPPEVGPYGTDPRLDAESAAQVAKLDADQVRGRAARIAQLERTFDAETARLDADGPLTPAQYEKRLKLRAEKLAKVPETAKGQQNLLGWVRHIFRDTPVEFYAVDDAGMQRQTGGKSGRGFTVKTGQTIAPDGTAKPLIRVFLNGDVEALPHEMLHALGEIDAPGYAEFRNEVNKTITPDQKKAFEQIYNTVYNGGLLEAQWKDRLTPEEVSNEIAAELFSRTVLGEDLSGVAPSLRKQAAFFTAGLLEKAGIPLGNLSRAQAKDFVPKGTKIKAGFSTLGLRPGVKAQALGQNFVQGLLKRASEERLKVAPEKSAIAGRALQPGDISRKPIKPGVTPQAKPVATPTASTPAAPPAPSTPKPRNIRTTEATQGDFAAQRHEQTKIDEATATAEALGDPEVIQHVDEISKALETGTPIEIEYQSVKNEGGAEAPSGRGVRRTEQENAYIAEAMGALPEDVRELAQKVTVPVRWETVAGKPQLLAMSLDKVIANIHKIAKEAAAHSVEGKIPYDIRQGTLTPDAWRAVVQDFQYYADNQANGYRGDGQKLTRPTEDIGLSIPAENPSFVPRNLRPEKANFLNLVMGLQEPPLTAREIRGKVPGNVKGQIIAEINARVPQKPSVIRAKDLAKQTFVTSGRDIAEMNPLRNELAADGVPVRSLLEVTERLSTENISKVTPRPDINLKAPVTDIIRGGFLPGLSKWREAKSRLAEAERRLENAVDEDRRNDISDEIPALRADVEKLAPSTRPLPEEILTQKSLEAVEWPQVRSELQSLDPETFKFQFGGADFAQVDRVLTALTDDPAKSPNSFPAGDRALLTRLYRYGRAQLLEGGKSPGQFLPGGKDFFNQNTVTEVGRAVLDSPTPESWQKLANDIGGLTGAAYRLGFNLKDVADVATLRAFEAEAKAKFDAAKSTMDFDTMMTAAGQTQFFKEAIETATGSSPGKHDLIGRSYLGADWKPPFPEEAAKGKLLPKVDEPRAVRSAAIRNLETGEISSGETHGEAMRNAGRAAGIPDREFSLSAAYSNPNYEQGFVTQGGEFLTRAQARTRVEEVGQIVPGDIAGATQLGKGENLESVGFQSLRQFLPATNFDKGLDPIEQAAIRTKGGRVVTGSWHGEALDKLVQEVQSGTLNEKFSATFNPNEPESAYDRGELTDGFVTVSGKFLTRPEAYAHGEKIKQLDTDFIERTRKRGGVLESQDFKNVRKFLPGSAPSTFKPLRDLAEKVAVAAGIEYFPVKGYAALNEELSKRLADFYEAAPSAPADPEVVASYAALSDETMKQYRALEAEGYKLEPFTGKGEPYKNSAEAVADIRDNKHLFVLPTAGNFSGGTDNPMLVPSGVEGLPTVNDVFRGVHDVFGHAKEGYQFGPRGEFNAWRAHAGMYSDEAQGALAAETLAQNSWVNFGPHLRGKTEVPPPERPFAEQKAVVVPKELIDEARGATEGQLLPKKRDEQPLRPEDIKAKAIKSPAVRLDNGRVIEAPIHALAISEALQEAPSYTGGFESGFTTNAGEFLTSKKALIRAEDLKQLKPFEGLAKQVGVLESGEFDRNRNFLPGLTGWILPNQKFVPLNNAYHEQYLADKASELNKKFGTKFSETADVESRLDALNRGFVRIRGGVNGNGALNIELNDKFFKNPTRKAIEGFLADKADDIDTFNITLLNNKGKVVDSAYAKVFEFDGKERVDALLGALETLRPRGGQMLPGGDGILPGLNIPSEERAKQLRVKARVAKSQDKFPEAVKLAYQKDDNGQFVLGEEGKPKPRVMEYHFMDTPVAREAAKGLKGDDRIRAVEEALGKKLTVEGRAALKRPDLQAGAKWYSTARTRLRGLFGDDSKFFTELLGATSARTPVEVNYRFALDAYNQFKQGKFEDILRKYRQGKSNWEARKLDDFFAANPANVDPTRGQYLDWWVEKHDLSPVQSNGKKFGANSRQVLKVLDGSWAEEIGGPKTPNFAGNLAGTTFEATVDVWAARLLHRLANEGNDKPWRILAEMETGVVDEDFAIGQAAYRYAAEKLGMKPDALQAVLWFAEKDFWERRGWTRGAGAEKSDFNVLLKETEAIPGGMFKMKTPQQILDFDLKSGEIKKR